VPIGLGLGSLLSSQPIGVTRGRISWILVPFAGLAVESEPATQTIPDNAVDDMQAKTSAALITTGREELSRVPDHLLALYSKVLTFHVA
jgi:hypothetical protein